MEGLLCEYLQNGHAVAVVSLAVESVYSPDFTLQVNFASSVSAEVTSVPVISPPKIFWLPYIHLKYFGYLKYFG